MTENSAPAVLVLSSLLQYYGDLLETLRSSHRAVQSHLNATLSFSAMQGETGWKSGFDRWRPLIEDSDLGSKNDAFGALFQRVFIPFLFEDATSTAGIEFGATASLSSAAAAAAAAAAASNVDIKFGAPTTLVQDAELVQSFCIAAGDAPIVVVGTHRGIAQLPVDALLSLPLQHQQQQQQQQAQQQQPSPMRVSPATSAATGGGAAAAASPLGKLIRKSASQMSIAALTSLAAAAPGGSSSSSGNLLGVSAPAFPPDSFLGGAQADVPTCLAPHPAMPFYLTASVSGAVQLYQCGFPEVLTLYRPAGGPRVNALRFSPSGTRFGAVDEAGMLALWQFDSNVASYQPFTTIPCHSKRAHDLCFLETGNLVATAGLSRRGGADSSGGASFHLAVWDTLMAPPKSCVAVFDCHPKVSGGGGGGLFPCAL